MDTLEFRRIDKMNDSHPESCKKLKQNILLVPIFTRLLWLYPTVTFALLGFRICRDKESESNKPHATT